MSLAGETLLAGLLASLACGLGALPLAIRGVNLERRIGLGYALASGLMFAASVYNLLLPGIQIGRATQKAFPILQLLFGMGLGALFLWAAEKHLTPERIGSGAFAALGGRTGLLVFVAMSIHSIPEGVAVGVGFASEEHVPSAEGLGLYITLAIALHNIPEGLAVALPMRAGGASIARCFVAAFLTSLPQPIAAVPAALLVRVFEPLLLPSFGFAAGAMIYLVLEELLPSALSKRTPAEVAWTFLAGFALMILVQLGL